MTNGDLTKKDLNPMIIQIIKVSLLNAESYNFEEVMT